MALIAGAGLFAAACINVAQATQAATADHAWKTYTNVRFQYKICDPADLLLPQGESGNSDGQTFLANDGGKLVVYRRNNALNDSLKDTLRDSFPSYGSVRQGDVADSQAELVRRFRPRQGWHLLCQDPLLT